MIYIFPGQFKHFTFIDEIKISHTGHFTIIIFQMKNRITVFLIAEHNMLHITCNRFQNLFLSRKNRDVPLLLTSLLITV